MIKVVRRCEVVTQLNSAPPLLKNYEKLPDFLKSQKCIKEYCFIVHDKDKYTNEDEAKDPNRQAGSLKPAHLHLLLRFEADQPRDIEYIAKWFDINPRFIAQIHGKWTDALLYMVHANAPNKYQYDTDEVFANFDYVRCINTASSALKIDDVLEKILTGEIKEYEKTKKIELVFYTKHKTVIDNAFKVYIDSERSLKHSRNTECIFITGDSGVGKTTLAKHIAQSQDLEYFISSGTNDLLDGYHQEPAIILDELRPYNIALADLLKLLDNNTASSIASRYYNKYVNCKLIIITTTSPIDAFAEAAIGEPSEQLKRRCKTHIRLTKDQLYISKWDKTIHQYSFPEIYNNPLPQLLPQKEDSDKIANDFIKTLSAPI